MGRRHTEGADIGRAELGCEMRGARAAGEGNRRVFYLCHTLRWLPTGFLMPVMVLILRTRGLSLADIGVVFAVYGTVTSVLELPTGGLADVLGRRAVLRLAAVLNLGLTLGFLFADALGPFIATAVIGGVGRALSTGPLEAWYVDAEHARDPDADLRGGLAGAGMLEGGAMGVAALVTGVLPWVTPGLPADGALVSHLTLPVVVAAAADVAHIAAVSTLITEHRATAGRAALGAAFRDLPGVVRAAAGLSARRGPVRLILVATACNMLGLAAVEALWQPHFAPMLGGTSKATSAFGFLVAAMFLAAAGGSWLAGRLPRPLASRPAVAAAVVLAGQGLLLATIGLPAGFELAAALFLAVYLFHGALWPVAHDLLHAAVPGAQRSTMLSAISLAGQAGGLIASLLLTRVAQAAGIPVAWGVGGAVVALGSLAFFRMSGSARNTGAGPRTARNTGAGPRAVRVAPAGPQPAAEPDQSAGSSRSRTVSTT